MSMLRQWLVQPKAVDAAYYITSKPDVAQKRADAGDIVMRIDRRERPDCEPGFIKVRKSEPTNTPPEDEEL